MTIEKVTEGLSNAHKQLDFPDDEMEGISIQGLDDDHKLHFPFYVVPNGTDPL